MENNKQIPKTASFVTNQWSTVVIPLTESDFASDGYRIKQYKFDPFGTTNAADLDNGDILYISGIRFVHELPTFYTENGLVYASEDGYIVSVGTKVHTTIASAIASLGVNGGTVLVEGDMIVDAASKMEVSGIARAAVTVKGCGADLAAQQTNLIWFQKTGMLREIPYNGNITFDCITLKAPTDEAGLFCNNITLTMGKNVIMEKTVKGNTDIDAAGTKDMSFNFGGIPGQTGTSTIDICGGSYQDVASLYQWNNTTATNSGINASSHYHFYNCTFTNVYAGVRNSSTGVLNINGDVTYDFYGGTFNNVYTGHYKYGKLNGNVTYNVYGGSFPNSIKFSTATSAGEKASAGNITVIVNSKSEYTLGNTVLKTDTAKVLGKNSGAKWIAVINNAEQGKASFDENLTADYKIKVYGGAAQPVFADGVLLGFAITSDSGNLTPVIGGTLLKTDESDIYDLSTYEGKETEIYFDELGIDTSYIAEDTSSQLSKFTVQGAQIRVPTASGTVLQGLRFVARMGKNITDNTCVAKPQQASDTGIGYGFIVIPNDLFTGKLTKETSEALIVPAVKTYTTKTDYIEYTACINNIPVKYYKRFFAVHPYITYKDSFGYTRTIYGEQYDTASIYRVAEKAISENDSASEWMQTNIIDAANAQEAE